jgi:hypothetical protein
VQAATAGATASGKVNVVAWLFDVGTTALRGRAAAARHDVAAAVSSGDRTQRSISQICFAALALATVRQELRRASPWACGAPVFTNYLSALPTTSHAFCPQNTAVFLAVGRREERAARCDISLRSGWAPGERSTDFRARDSDACYYD